MIITSAIEMITTANKVTATVNKMITTAISNSKEFKLSHFGSNHD